MNPSGKKILVVIALCLLAITIGILAFSINKGRGNIELVTVPENAITEFKTSAGVVLKKEGSGTLPLEPGDYVVTAQSDGFISKAVNLSLNTKDKRQTLVLTLEPSSVEAREWAKKNEKKYQDAEGKAGESDRKSGEEFRSSNPIISSLPYNSGYYRIDYGIDRNNNDSFKLVITADTPNKRQVALEKIREFGYDPSDFVIEFKGVGNVFVGGSN
jgi:hypothetical protein